LIATGIAEIVMPNLKIESMPSEEKARDMDVEGSPDMDCSIIFESVLCTRVEGRIEPGRRAHNALGSPDVSSPPITRHVGPVNADLDVLPRTPVAPSFF
jgi:hypothetical protein